MVTREYAEEDTYNMNEAALFWKLMYSRELSSQCLPGLKKDKAQISICFYTNATGLDQLPVRIINKAKTS